MDPSDGDSSEKEAQLYCTLQKLTVVEFAEKTNNCAAQRKFGVSEKLLGVR